MNNRVEMLMAFAVVALMSGNAAAQDMAFSPDATRACLAATGAERDADLVACAGLAAERCMAESPGGQSTAGMGNCFHAESEWWAGEVDTAYRDLMAQAREMDGLNGPYAPSQVEALAVYRAAWEAYRGAKCGYAQSQWGGGTGGGPAYASCVLHENAGFHAELRRQLSQ